MDAKNDRNNEPKGETRLVSPSEAAARLGVSESAILKWIKQGRLRAVRLGRALRLDLGEVETVASKGLPRGRGGERCEHADGGLHPGDARRGTGVK